MVTTLGAFSGFSTNDSAAALEFWGGKVGLDVKDGGMGGILQVTLPGGGRVIIYPKGEGHQPSTYTVLNLEVADVAAAIVELGKAGIEPERYEGMPQDADGAMRGNGPDIAWFTDPAGNIFSVIADS